MAITLDGSAGITTPGVTDTGNLSVTGTSSFTGSVGNITAGTVTQTGSSSATAFIPTGSSVPANGMYLSAANTLNFSTNTTNRMNIDSSGNLQVGGTTVGNTAGYVNSRTNARAWVNFNGTLTTPITPRANYNVSSVTKNGTGDYTLNFTTALADANYVVSVNSETLGSTSYGFTGPYTAGQTTSSCRVTTLNPSGAVFDRTYVYVAIFGN